MSALNREETDRIGMGHQQEACEQSENEGFFRSLIQYAPNVVIFLSPDHRILEFNPEAERLYGRKRADVLGKNYLELFLPDDVREVVAADIEKVLTGEASRGFENIIIAQDGRERILSWNVDRVLDSDNKAVGIVAISQDITEGRKTDQALRESEDKYRSLVAHIPDVVWSTDHEGRTTFISPNVERAYGYTPEEIYQEGERLWFERIHPDDAERVKEAFEGVFEKGEQLDVEYRIKRKDGEWIWLRDRSVGAYEKDGKKYADGVFSDITEKKRSEEHALHYQKQLQNEKAFAEAIIDSLPASFYMFDEQGYYFRWNKMERDDRGATDEEMPRLHCLEGIMDEDRAVVQKAVEEVFKYGRGEVELREYSKPRGEYRTQLCTGTRVDIDGVPYLVGVGIDITERRLLEDKLRGSEERYRTLVERVNEMIFMHDPDYNLTYVSPQCEKMTGYTAQELIGQKWHSYATGNPVNRLAVDILAQAKQTGKSPEPHLVEVRKKDGELIILEVNDSILRDPEGDIIGVVGSARDITHQLMMEKALSKNEERLRYTLESTNDGIWDWNLQTDSVYWSPRMGSSSIYLPLSGISPSGSSRRENFRNIRSSSSRWRRNCRLPRSVKGGG